MLELQHGFSEGVIADGSRVLEPDLNDLQRPVQRDLQSANTDVILPLAALGPADHP